MAKRKKSGMTMTKTTSAEHPLKKILDGIWNAGHTPRVILDATHSDVIVPIHLKKNTSLVFDLKAADPLNIEFDSRAWYADLAFQGTVMRCTVPWRRISAIIDRDTGHGVRVTDPEKLVEDVPETSDPDKTPVDPPPTTRGPFRVFQGGKK